MDISANKQDTTPSSVSQTKVVASELNQLIAEQNNVITTGGELTPSSSDTTQLLTSIQKVSKDKAAEVIANDYDVDEPWEKPADWIDIRSGALSNSVYFLVGHKADYSSYDKFAVYATVSTTGNTYDVYVDGNKVATTASGSETVLTWSTLALTSGYDVTYPSALRTHIVRVTPSVSTDTLDSIRHGVPSNGYQMGTLWIHFTTTQPISIQRLCFGANYGAEISCRLLEAATSATEWLQIKGQAEQAFYRCYELKEAPKLEKMSGTSAYSITSMFGDCRKLKTVYLKNMGNQDYGSDCFSSCYLLEKIHATGSCFSPHSFRYNYALKELPEIDFSANAYTNAFVNCTGLKDTFLQDTNASRTRLNINCSADYPARGIKGLTVSPEAPFTNTTSPQLKLDYTGLDRQALRQLFKSMPYNVAYKKVGNPTIVDGAASGFSVNDFVMTSQMILLSSTDKLETVIKLNFNTLESIRNYIVYEGGYFALFTYNSKFGCSFQDSVSGWSHRFELGDTLSVNTDYWVKVYYEEGSLVLSLSTDGANYTTFATISTTISSMSAPSSFMFGYPLGTNDNYMHGSIDLNQTYIKVNGQTWFGPGVTKNLVPGGTLVGSPTITNGIASGFSTSKYIKMSSLPTLGTNDFELFTKVTVTARRTQRIITDAASGSYYTGILMSGSSGNLEAGVYVSDSERYYVHSSTSMAANSTCYVKFYRNGNTLGLQMSTDGVTYTTDTITIPEGTSLQFKGDMFCFGCNPSYGNEWNGSIDLNNTYFKVGSTYVYRGMVPQVKTCSIVGCTGTSSLTPDDKLICTSKGWELTTEA